MEHKNRKEKEEERERWRIDGEEGRREGGCFLGVGGRTLNQEEVKGIILKDKKKCITRFHGWLGSGRGRYDRLRSTVGHNLNFLDA